MNAIEWFPPTILTGHFVRLEPMTFNHSSDLAEACDEHMFDFFPIYPPEITIEGLETYIAERTKPADCRAFAVIDLTSGKAIGSSSMFDVRPEHKTLEIGHTWIKQEFRGTKVNPEMKFLMLQHAFDVLGCNRVQIKTDQRNLQSQAAIKKLGAMYEGTLRNNMMMPDGHIRTTVFYSIIPEEWPAIKERLLKRLNED